jgi:hypothetical protein
MTMEYDLLRDRGFTVTGNTPAMRLFFFYSSYKKDRTESA